MVDESREGWIPRRIVPAALASRLQRAAEEEEPRELTPAEKEAERLARIKLKADEEARLERARAGLAERLPTDMAILRAIAALTSRAAGESRGARAVAAPLRPHSILRCSST